MKEAYLKRFKKDENVYSITTGKDAYNYVVGRNRIEATNRFNRDIRVFWRDNTDITRMYKFNRKRKKWDRLKV